MSGAEPAPFPDYMVEVMAAGNVWEQENLAALDFFYPVNLLPTQRVMGNDIWAGSDDFELVELSGANYVVEHKNTSDANFRYGNRLPYNFHCFQVLGYAYFLGQTTDENWYARIYYHGRGYWAEFDVWESIMPQESQDSIVYEGQMNGKYTDGTFDTTLDCEMKKLEQYWGTGELPPTYPTPMDFDVTFGCTKARGRKGHKRHYPSCRWWEHCWPNLPYDQPVKM